MLLLLLNPIIKRDEAIETMIAYLSSGIAPLLWAWNRLMLMQTRVLGAIDSLAAWAIFSPLSLSLLCVSRLNAPPTVEVMTVAQQTSIPSLPRTATYSHR